MTQSKSSIDAIRALARHELSMRARIGYVSLMLTSSSMTVVIVSLWLTEPALPVRTRAAFGVMTLIGASWTAFSLWVLTTRRVLLARDRVIAGRLAVTFTGLFVAGAGIAIAMQGGAAAFGALVTGVVMLGAAVWTLRVAQRRFAALAARRAQLEQALV